jgi:transcriptional regulator with XRE-family HTH domain
MRKQYGEERQLEFCPDCGARLVPAPQEMKRLRQLASLSQRTMADRLNVKASRVAYLERGSRNPSGALILRYRKLKKRLLAKIKADGAARAMFADGRSSR